MCIIPYHASHLFFIPRDSPPHMDGYQHLTFWYHPWLVCYDKEFHHQTLEFWNQILKSFNIFGFKSNFHYLCNQKKIKYQYDNAYFRADAGPLWENFVIAERLKRNSYNGSIANSWFWRTQQQKEIDYLEEENGQLKAYEFKWNDKKASVRTPGSFAKAYPEATFHVITPKNADEFLVL